MKYARGMFAGFLILVSVSSIIPLGGCERGDYRRDRGYSREYNREYNRGHRHYYRDGRWHRRNLFGFDIIVSALVIGALIDSLPPRHETVVVEGIPYYHDDRYYYRQHPNGGYVVIAPPGQSQNNYDERRGRGGNRHNEENRGERY